MIDSAGKRRLEPEGAGSRSKNALIRRLRRIEGQVQGLQKMIANDRDSVDVLTLVAQVRGALHSLGALVLEAHLVESAAAAHSAPDRADQESRLARMAKVFRTWGR